MFFYIPKIITALNMIVDQLSIVVPVVSDCRDRILPWSAARAGRQDYRNKETRVKKKILILYPPLSTFINSSSLQYRPPFLLIIVMILFFSLSYCAWLIDRALWTSESSSSTLRDIYSSQTAWIWKKEQTLMNEWDFTKLFSVKIDKISDIHMN